nr:PH domain-containing protein [Saccharibacillus sp. JS10]
MEVIGWKRFTYEEAEDRITIRKGIIQRSEKIIYYSRIHSVSQEQPLIQRLLGVVQLKIETPGGKSEGDATLPVLRRQEAERLQHVLNERSAAASQSPVEQKSGEEGNSEAHTPKAQQESTLLYRLSPGRLLQAALTELNIGLAVAFIAGLISFADDLLPDRWVNQLVTNAQAYFTGIKAILIIIAVALVGAWLLSVLLFVIKFAGFSLYRQGDRLSIRYGLLERKQFLFDPSRVQSVTVKEGWLRQLLGYAHVEINVVSSSSEKETPALHPFIARKQIEALLEQTVPQFTFASAQVHPPKRALFGYVRAGLLFTIVLAAVLIYFFPHIGRWALLLIPIVFALDYWIFRTSGARLDGDRLTIVNRAIAKQTHFTLKRHIVAIQLGGSHWQRKGQMLNLKAHLLGGSGGSSLRIARLNASDAQQIYEWYRRDRRSRKL